MHYHERARRVRETRERFHWYAKAQAIPRLEAIMLFVYPLAADRRWKPDVAACYPTVKAAIDGLVDAGVLADDDETHLRSITFFPRKVCGKNGIKLIIREVL